MGPLFSPVPKLPFLVLRRETDCRSKTLRSWTLPVGLLGVFGKNQVRHCRAERLFPTRSPSLIRSKIFLEALLKKNQWRLFLVLKKESPSPDPLRISVLRCSYLPSRKQPFDPSGGKIQPCRSAGRLSSLPVTRLNKRRRPHGARNPTFRGFAKVSRIMAKSFRAG